MKKLGIITISMAVIVNIVGTNVMAKDDKREYSLHGYEQWKAYGANEKKEIVNNGMVNPVMPKTDAEILSADKTIDKTCTQTEVKGQNSSESIEKNYNYKPPHDEAFMKWHQPGDYNHYNDPANGTEKKYQTSGNVVSSEVPAWCVNGKVYQNQADTKAPEQTKAPNQTKEPEQTTDYSTKKSEKSFTYNSFNHPEWGRAPGMASMPIPGHAYGYTPPIFGQPSHNTSELKPGSSGSEPDNSSNKDSSKEQTSDNTSKPEFHPPPHGYNSTPCWQTAYNLDKHNFDGDKQFPVEQQIDGIDTALLQDSKSSSKLTLINAELEKSRQELVVIRNDAKRQISIEIKETRNEMHNIVSNNRIDKKDTKLKINELKSEFKLKVKNIKEDATTKAKDVIEKQDSNIQSILN